MRIAIAFLALAGVMALGACATADDEMARAEARPTCGTGEYAINTRSSRTAPRPSDYACVSSASKRVQSGRSSRARMPLPSPWS